MVSNNKQIHDLDAVLAKLADKPFFKIGEVAKLLGVKTHVLRYWESEFSSIRPKKNPSGQRIYVKADIEVIVEIQKLLYNEQYTISGAKQLLARQRQQPPGCQLGLNREPVEKTLATLKTHVNELLALLEHKAPMA